MLSIVREFHAVGQGAFYSEKHCGFNIVYDCGNWRNSRSSTTIVENAFRKGDEIDVLFISHFDYDHVNKINVLARNFNIKRVVMPLIHEQELNLLVNFYRLMKYNILTLLLDPERFFGEGTDIIRISPALEQDYFDFEDRERNFIEIDKLSERTLASGTVLVKKFDFYEWIFIPFNHENKSRYLELESELYKLGLSGSDIYSLKHDPDYTINKIVSDVGKSKKNGGKKFKEAYDNVTGGINSNSMLVFSGLRDDSNIKVTNYIHYDLSSPSKFERNYIFKSRAYCEHEICSAKVSCVYTGDCDLNLVKPKNIFSDFWSTVGTIQVPHHGALNNFCWDVLDASHYYFPLSVGLNNTYSHPSRLVIDNIALTGSSPVLITENPSSKLTQTHWVK